MLYEVITIGLGSLDECCHGSVHLGVFKGSLSILHQHPESKALFLGIDPFALIHVEELDVLDDRVSSGSERSKQACGRNGSYNFV